ncbi:MAG: hypothetical protein ACFFDI_18445 [Promethearchaeota archaeon]
MYWQNVLKWAKSDYVKLVPILGLAFYLAFIPHQNYPYPVHVDEWTHLACSNEIIKEAKAFDLTDPLQGGPPIGNQLVEVGFHTFWAAFHLTSDIDWFTIFKYFPSVMFMFTVLSVYVLAKRRGFGWEAALLTCLIPTTIGVLGPGFLIPVAMGLPFIVVSIFIAFYLRNWWSYVLLAIFTLFLLSLHSATAVGLILILIPYIIINLKGGFKHSLGMILALIIPFVASLIIIPEIKNLIVSSLKTLLVQQSVPTYVDIPDIITAYGYLPILLCLLGAFLLMTKRSKTNYGLVLGLVVLLMMYAIFQNYGYGIWPLYNRSLQYVCLVMSIVAGAGLMGVKVFTLPTLFRSWVKSRFIINNAGRILCVIIIVVMLYLAIPARQQTYYYHIIDNADYKAFIWIRDNLGSEYEKVILDPWKGAPFTAITGKNVYAWIMGKSEEDDRSAYAFLSSGCKDTDFLEKNGISIVYTREVCDNPNLVEVEKNIYLLEEH